MGEINKKNKIEWIDAMKGILILLMVIGHTYIRYKSFIYLFHMAVFFMISGYCWNDRHSKSVSEIKSFVLKRIVRLYIPFVGINIAYILLNNFFIRIGLYTNVSEFISCVGNTPVQQHLYSYISLPSILKKILRTLCFAGGSSQLSGATWFLTTLFMVSVFHCAIIWVFKIIKINNLFTKIILFLVFLVIAGLIDNNSISMLGAVERFPAAYVAYLAGIIIKDFEKKESYFHLNEKGLLMWITVFIFSFIILLVFYMKGTTIELAYSEICEPGTFIICSLLGWILIRSVSVILCQIDGLRECVQYFGKRTIPILLFHTISFKFVSMLYIYFSKENPLLLASYPVIFSSPEWMRYVYALTGVLIPLLIYKIYFEVKARIMDFCSGH